MRPALPLVAVAGKANGNRTQQEVFNQLAEPNVHLHHVIPTTDNADQSPDDEAGSDERKSQR